MGSCHSRLCQEQNLPPFLVSDPDIIAFFAVTLHDDRSTLTDPGARVPVCRIPYDELSTNWTEAATQLQSAFVRESPPLYVVYRNKRIAPQKWPTKKAKMASHNAFVYFDERTPYQPLDTTILRTAPFALNVTILSSPFPNVHFPPLSLQVLPLSSIEALRALIGRWIEMEVQQALQQDVRVAEERLMFNMVWVQPDMNSAGRMRNAATTSDGHIEAEGVDFEIVTQLARAPVGVPRSRVEEFEARAGPVLLPATGKVGEWTGWSLCVCVFQDEIELV